MSKFTVECVEFKPLEAEHSMRLCDGQGHELRLVLHDVTLHQKGDSRWASLPSKPLIKDGVAITDDRGKVAYAPVISFEGSAVRDAFSQRVIEAVLASPSGRFSRSQAS